MWPQIWTILSASLYLLNIGLAVAASIMLISSRRDPVKTLTWVLVLLLLPYIGIVLYFFFGRNFRKDKMFSRKGASDIALRKELCREMLHDISKENSLPDEIRPFSKMIVQNLKSAQSILASNNEVKIYFNGKDALNAMLDAMRSAKTHIHLQSFIIEDDKVGQQFKDVLIAKAKEGVEVRMMYDGFGGRKLSRRFLSELSDAGVELLNFSPFRLIFLPPIVNYRNHRKILVVDGQTGFLGGCNIADRYMDGGDFPEWRDTHVRIC